ncbi:MAG: tail fiber protein [Bdellovibrionales bacterium]|nr:tail fiber protein [Bdellovibrionales bacterium]
MNKRVRYLAVAGIGLIATVALAQLKPNSLNFVAPTINDKANVYEPRVGEIVYDSSDSTFYGRFDVGGIPDWQPFSAGASTSNPSGTVIIFAGTTCPSGYLPADGKSYLQSNQTSLFAAISTAHGDGSTGSTGDVGCPSGSGCFNVPDYRGRFLRGVDASTGRDPDAATGRVAMAAGGNINDNVGSVEEDAFQGHYHSIQGGVSSGPGTVTLRAQNSGSAGAGTFFTIGAPISDGSNGTPRTSSESRPKNAFVNYCIKT